MDHQNTLFIWACMLKNKETGTFCCVGPVSLSLTPFNHRQSVSPS